MSKFDLNEAVAIVTGGSRGIGPHIAEALTDRGAKVAIVARSEAGVQATARKLRKSGATVLAITADVTSAPDRQRIVAAVEREFGVIDVLVNNAGGDSQREFHKLSEEEIEAVLDLNLTSPLLLARLVLPGMLDRGRGHIVNVSSMAGRTAFPFTEAYGAAKDGLIAFSRVLRSDYGRLGISASTLILGPVRDEGIGQRTAIEVGLKLPPKAFTVSPAAIGKATVKAISRDKAELVLLPGPGKSMRAMMDRFPGFGPTINRKSGAEATMRTVAEYREREADASRAERSA